jgi:hypothetical protein
VLTAIFRKEDGGRRSRKGRKYKSKKRRKLKKWLKMRG